MKHNFLNLDASEIEKPIYRVFSKHRLKEVFETSRLSLVKPRKWDDPFENFLFNSIGQTIEGKKISFGIRENFFGQCWTLHRETDAMWRIYSPDKDGIKVKTSIHRLFSSFYDSQGKFRELSCFIGKVKYLSQNDIISIATSGGFSPNIVDQSGVGQAQTLLIKRYEFRHENEVRLIYNAQKDLGTDADSFKIKPNELFDEIIFDPRMEDNSVRKLTEQFVNDFGFKNKVEKSKLYNIPEFIVKLNI
jgi:hypothetical protein